MPSIEANRMHWNQYDWDLGGKEWSRPWGSTERLWKHVIWPRIGASAPWDLTVEIGCGYGRITRFLRPHTRALRLFDITERCVAACHDLFVGDEEVSVMSTDGLSLPNVPAQSVDLVLSYDSLVHAEDDVVSAYIFEIARVLNSEGQALIHHSNLLDIGRVGGGTADPGWRGTSVGASTVRAHAEKAGLGCSRQELLEWGDGRLTDCFTWLTATPSGRRTHVSTFPRFLSELEVQP